MSIISKLDAWIKLRKNTTPVHWAFGFLCAYFMVAFGLLFSLIMMGIMAGDQVWNDWEEKANKPGYKPSGCTDWWESWLTYCIGAGVVALLHHLSIVSVGWI